MSPPAESALGRAIRSALTGNKRIRQWQLRGVRRTGFQTYLVKDQLESERRTDGETFEVTVFVANGDLLGRATATLGPGDEHEVGKRIEDTVYMAGLGGDAPWNLPTTGTWPKVELLDAALAGEKARATSRAIVEQWRSAAAAIDGVRPSSMELFCGEEWTTLENSAGLKTQEGVTRVSLLTLLLADGAHPAERYSFDERRRAADLDVRAIVRRVGEEARDLVQAVVPPSGTYAVVIDADEIEALLDPVRVNASAEGLYQKSSRFELGKPIPIEGAGGDPFTMISNAVAPYGVSSYSFDSNGVAGQRVEIVKDGVFAQPWAPKQFADYLGTSPTGRFGTLELPAGRAALADLTHGERVLYVRSFSWLTPDAARGNFGSEIRVGYLYENGSRKPIKGGTVSGNVFKALGTAKYSSETVFRGTYLGPEAVRFEGLTIAGA